MSDTATGRRALGVDVGTVRVGLAISDPDRTVATALETLSASELEPSGRDRTRASDRTGGRRPGDPPARDDEEAWAAGLAARILELAAERDVGTVVVGLPKGMSGRDTASTRAARAVARAVEQGGVEVALEDERLSSVTAERALRAEGRGGRERRARRDQVAAVLILQSWLDAQRR